MAHHHIEHDRAALERAWRLPAVDPEPLAWDCISGWSPPPGCPSDPGPEGRRSRDCPCLDCVGGTGPSAPMPAGLRLAGILAALLLPTLRRRRP